MSNNKKKISKNNNITETRYLIIGNSTAAVNAIETIRKQDREGSIGLVSDESRHTYSRPLISYFLSNKVEEDNLTFRPSSFYSDHKVQTWLGKKAIHLEPKAKEITLDDQNKIRFEKLLLATGGTPIVPPLPGQDLSGVFTFTTIEDAYKVQKFISDHKVKKAVVIGGGLIGLKVTEALLALDLQVTIVELADRILSATFDKAASGIIEKALSGLGCITVTSNTVEEILAGEENKVAEVILKDKTGLETDLVILAIGVRPRVDLAKEAGLAINRGILVNEYMETSESDIFAAGDVIETYDIITESFRPMAILPNASQQGKIAGWNMAGVRKVYGGGLAMNSVELAGIPTISVGITEPSLLQDPERQKDIEILKEYDGKKALYKKIVLENNRIIGLILISRIDRAGIYTGLIKDKVDISSFKDRLLKDDFGLLSLPKEYRTHLVTGHGIEV